MNVLDLCTGIGGFSLAFKHLIGGYRTVCYVEIDKYCQKVLRARIADGVLDDAPIWDDLLTFDGRPWRGCVDLITAGFPCQPFSVAGKQRGESDERNLWPDVGRVICEVRPRNVLLENVPGLLVHRYFSRILKDLAESGYDLRWDCIPASAVGANHQRDRLWILCHTDQHGRKPNNGRRTLPDEERDHSGEVWHQLKQPGVGNASHVADTTSAGRDAARSASETIPQPRTVERSTGRSSGTINWRHTDGLCDEVADANHQRDRLWVVAHTNQSRLQNTTREQQRGLPQTERKPKGCKPSRGATKTQRGQWWTTEPNVGRVAHGVPARVDRLRSLGNGIVPVVAAVAWDLLHDPQGGSR